MKAVFSFLLASFFFLNVEASFVGQYEAPHAIAFLSYDTAEACKADNGRWNDDLCIMDAGDTLTVSQTDGVYKIEVETITTNAHSCGFEGIAVTTSPTQLVAKTPSDVWDYEQKKHVQKICEVTVDFTQDGTTASVKANENCEGFCGANAVLNITAAKKK